MSAHRKRGKHASDQMHDRFSDPSGHSAVSVNDRLYVFGGRDAAGRVLSTIEEYDPLTNNWVIKGGKVCLLERVSSAPVSSPFACVCIRERVCVRARL